MDEVYRGYRIAIREHDGWIARITDARGPAVPLTAHATLDQGPEACVLRARALIDRYMEFLDRPLDGPTD